LFLAGELAPKSITLDDNAFKTATYFEEVHDPARETIKVAWPEALRDIVDRWRIFYAHYFLSVALEGLFVSVVRKGMEAGLGGFKLEALLGELDGKHVLEVLHTRLDFSLPSSFLESTPRDVGVATGFRVHGAGNDGGGALGLAGGLDGPLSEAALEDLLRDQDVLHSPAGVALGLLLAAVVIQRFNRWQDAPPGIWLRNNVYDASEDVTVPIVLHDVSLHYDNWWNTRWGDLGERLIRKFVVRQHETLAYDKSRSGGKILFHTEQGRIIGRHIPYDNIGVTNPRFPSAIQIITDLGWIRERDDGVLDLTGDGRACLTRELSHMEGER
jgi:hypothetical protein